MNNDAPWTWPPPVVAESRVLDLQRKLYRWARTEPSRRFDDVFNLVYDRATLVVAWEKVRSNRGARTAGVDTTTRRDIEQRIGVSSFLEDIRTSLKEGTFRAQPVRQTSIPKKGGKVRYLGIPTMRDRTA